MTNTPLIDIHDVYKSFGDKSVLEGVTLSVDAGEVLAIIGVSGCGKSTLLRVISGLEPHDSGTVELNNPNTSFVFQYSALFDSMTVFENVAFPLIEHPDDPKATFVRRSPEEIRQTVLEKLALVGMEDTEDLYPSQISGGMQKRVSFARAIVHNPKIIFYDEPTAGLDPVASTRVEDTILKLGNELGAASVVVTHQHSTIHRTADKICLLHEGHIRWSGAPSILETSNDPYAYQFAHATLDGPLSD